MAIINFTAENRPSTPGATGVGYFGLLETVFPDIPYGYYGDLWTAQSNADPDEDRLNTALYQARTTQGDLSLASFFNTPDLIREAITCNFSNQAEYISLSPFSLLSASYRWLGVHSFENDVFNLGGGSDHFDLYLALDSYEFEESSIGFKTLYDYVLDGGYRTTVNGGAGNDHANLSWGEGLYTVSSYLTNLTPTVIPLAIVNGDAGNDHLEIQGMAARVNGDGGDSFGADIITTDFLSDRIYGGPGADVINGSQQLYPTSNAIWRLALQQKDVITGGPGRDTYVLDGSNAYGLNGSSDFAVITDFQANDRISSHLFRGDLLIARANGTVDLPSTVSYSARSLNYTARILLDSDDSNSVTTGDELLFYVCGAEPSASNFIYGV